MSKPVIIEELPYDPELERAFAKAERNNDWFCQHANELGVFEKHRGRYVAAAGGELFVADTPEDLARLVHEEFPDEVLCMHHIPHEKRDRIAFIPINRLECEESGSPRLKDINNHQV